MIRLDLRLGIRYDRRMKLEVLLYIVLIVAGAAVGWLVAPRPAVAIYMVGGGLAGAVLSMIVLELLKKSTPRVPPE